MTQKASDWSQLAEDISNTVSRLLVLSEGSEVWYPTADLLGEAQERVEGFAGQLALQELRDKEGK